MRRKLILILLVLPVVLASCAKKEKEAVPEPPRERYELGELGEPVELSKYFPPNPILFLHVDDLRNKLDKFKGSKMLGDYLKTKNYEDFQKSRLFRKLGLRFKDLGELAGVGMNLNTLANLAGRETALALYDIGELQFVYVTVMPKARFIKSNLYKIREKFEQRKLDDKLYFIREREDGTLAFAFALVGNKLLISNNLRLFETSLSHLKNPSGGLSEQPKFFTLFIKDFLPHDITMWLDQSLLNENLYFNNYWIFKNSDELGWIGNVLIDVEIKEDEIRERKILGHREAVEARQNVDTGTLGRFILGGLDYFSIESLAEPEHADSIFRREMLPDTVLALFEDQRPEAVAVLIRSKYDENNFLLKLDKAVIFELEELDISRFKEILLGYYQGKYVVGDLFKVEYQEKSGIYSLNLPIFETISFYEEDSILVIANSKSFCKEIKESYPNTDHEKWEELSRLVYVNFNKIVGDYDRLTGILAARPNWRNPENQSYFRNNIGSLLQTASFISTVFITDQTTEGATFETVVYKR